MIEAKQLASRFGGAPLGLAIVLRADEKAATRPLFGGIGQAIGGTNYAVTSDQGSAAFVRIRFDPMASNGVGHAREQTKRHLPTLPCLIPEPLGQILLPAVAEDDDDDGVGGLASHPQRAG